MYDILGSSDGPVLGDDAMGELLGDDMGDDMGADLMGARGRGRGLARPTQRGLQRPPLLTPRPGMNPPAVGRLPLGFGVLTCNSAANPTGGSLVARPQVAWRGSKLVVGIAGVNSANYAVQMRPIIGNKPLLAGAGTVDARAYGSTAIDNNLIGDSASPGVDVTLEFIVTPALAVGDSVIVQATWTGDGIV